MVFNQLKHGDVFHIDGEAFQCYHVYGRLVSCLVLTPDMQHVPAPNDASGFGLLSTIFSDLRFNRNNATAAECAAYLLTLNNANNAIE
jgi:hypothetical protein